MPQNDKKVSTYPKKRVFNSAIGVNRLNRMTMSATGAVEPRLGEDWLNSQVAIAARRLLFLEITAIANRSQVGTNGTESGAVGNAHPRADHAFGDLRGSISAYFSDMLVRPLAIAESSSAIAFLASFSSPPYPSMLAVSKSAAL